MSEQPAFSAPYLIMKSVDHYDHIMYECVKTCYHQYLVIINWRWFFIHSNIMTSRIAAGEKGLGGVSRSALLFLGGLACSEGWTGTSCWGSLKFVFQILKTDSRCSLQSPQEDLEDILARQMSHLCQPAMCSPAFLLNFPSSSVSSSSSLVTWRDLIV